MGRSDAAGRILRDSPHNIDGGNDSCRLGRKSAKLAGERFGLPRIPGILGQTRGGVRIDQLLQAARFGCQAIRTPKWHNESNRYIWDAIRNPLSKGTR
jgi:hypothetical protein